MAVGETSFRDVLKTIEVAPAHNTAFKSAGLLRDHLIMNGNRGCEDGV
jgi:hypothetical protein